MYAQRVPQNQAFLLAIMGPTGSGKSELAEAIADETGALLVNADAFQIYRGLSVGTNKPTEPERYRLLDIRDPADNFGVGEWIPLACEEIQACYEGGRSVIIVGGTGFYIRALMEEFQNLEGAPDPELREQLDEFVGLEGVAAAFARLERENPTLAAVTDPQNPYRVRRALERSLAPTAPILFQLPPYPRIKIGIRTEPEFLNPSLDARTEKLLESGWINEVKTLLEQNVSPESPGMRAIGYRSIVQFILGEGTRQETLELIRTQTRQYAKRQRSWLRSEPNLTWVQFSDLFDRNAYPPKVNLGALFEE